MKKHILKIQPEYYNEVVNGNKPFELRKNDRDFKKGDFVLLEKIDPNGETNPAVIRTAFEISYVLTGGKYGLDPDYCILGFARVQVTDLGRFIALYAFLGIKLTPTLSECKSVVTVSLYPGNEMNQSITGDYLSSTTLIFDRDGRFKTQNISKLRKS